MSTTPDAARAAVRMMAERFAKALKIENMATPHLAGRLSKYSYLTLLGYSM